MDSEKIILDTCVLIAGLRSRLGASYRLIQSIGKKQFTLCLSVPLFLEYETVLKRQRDDLGLTGQDIDAILNYLAAVSEHHAIRYLWRPALKDPHDDMILELAVAAGCTKIVTHNIRDFGEANQFGIEIVKPLKFLKDIGVLP